MHCARVEDTLKRMEAVSEMVIKEEDLSSLIEDADAVFSQWVRLKNASQKGFAKCFTCGIEKHWTILQNGHYIKRSNLYLRWDERNCRPQCQQCNEMDYGNIPAYTERLEKECKGITDILRSDAVLAHKPTREEIRQIIAEYTPKVKALKEKLTNA
ncbi:MAG TPA: recombination protein NinG [Agriterribacter sp.]|nr:recombination protein NinG [Agriterribacter sp.]